MINSLKQLYPNSLLNPIDLKRPEDYYHFQALENSLFIPLCELKNDQIKLLNIFSENSTSTTNSLPANPIEESWYQFLTKNSPAVPSGAESVRILQLDFYKLPEQFAYDIWKDTLKDSLEAIITILSLNERRLLVILDADRLENDTVPQLTGLITTLDDDFEVATRGIIGQIHRVSQALPSLYENELMLFNQAIQSDIFKEIQYLSDTLLNEIGHEATAQQPILANLRQQILSNSEYEATIRTLFAHRGNLTQAAEALFVHRNTLTYRMNKFTKESGFNLQHLPDLIICYLASN